MHMLAKTYVFTALHIYDNNSAKLSLNVLMAMNEEERGLIKNAIRLMPQFIFFLLIDASK